MKTSSVRLAVLLMVIASFCFTADVPAQACTYPPKTGHFLIGANPPATCLSLLVTCRCDRCELGLPIEIEIAVANATANVQVFWQRWYDTISECDLALTDAAGKPVPMTDAGKKTREKGNDIILSVGPIVRLAPGEWQSNGRPADLTELFKIRSAGVYIFTASKKFFIDPGHRECTATSSPLRITVEKKK